MYPPPGLEGVAPLIARDRPSLRGHIEIARLEHWVKNVFVLPGVAAAVALDPVAGSFAPSRLIVGLLGIGLVASSYYTINEVLDAPFDRHHPTKRTRAVPSGRVSIPLAYLQWILLGLAGFAVGLWVSLPFAVTLVVLWLMACLYNFRPFRTKDLPYLDVLTEGVNNPLRMLAGWFVVTSASIPPASLLLGYWMIGCYLMATKRLAEFRHIGDIARIAAYRKSLAAVTERRLMMSIVFYGSIAMLFFGAFIMRYRLELIMTFPFVALVMAAYFNLAFEDDSAAQNPEKLYREPALMASVGLCLVAIIVFFYVDVPFLHFLFAPTIPEAVQPAV